jgi:hypothetical protein
MKSRSPEGFEPSHSIKNKHDLSVFALNLSAMVIGWYHLMSDPTTKPLVGLEPTALRLKV